MISPIVTTRIARLIQIRGQLAGVPMFGPGAKLMEAFDLALGLLGDLTAEIERLDAELQRLKPPGS